MTTLQINTTGAWRTVCEFDESKRGDVLAAARILHSALGGKAKWCTLTGGQREWLHLDNDPPSAVLLLQDDGDSGFCDVSLLFMPGHRNDSTSHHLAVAAMGKVVKLAGCVEPKVTLS